jgi:NADP-dependent 3-hydroxy acid dehydrogenase YdfG
MALGLARNGHDVIAAAHSWPQVTQLRAKVAKLKLDNIRAVKLDLLDTYDVAQASTWDFDVLVNGNRRIE